MLSVCALNGNEQKYVQRNKSCTTDRKLIETQIPLDVARKKHFVCSIGNRREVL